MSRKKGKAKTKEKTVEKTSSEEVAEAVVEEEKAPETSEVTEATKTTDIAEVAEEKEEIAEEKPAPEKKELKKKEEEEEEIVEERVYTVPLGKAWISPRKKHSPRAIRMIRSFVVKHMKTDSDSVRITNEVNEKIWSRGIEKPPRKIRVRITKNAEGIVTVRPTEGD
jgi:large subunit ribosomal protein L31e